MSATAIPTEEQVLLTRSEVRALLKADGRVVTRVERYCVDGAALFIGAFGRPWTAWLDVDRSGAVTVQYEEGWSADFGSCSRVSPSRSVSVPSDDDRDQA